MNIENQNKLFFYINKLINLITDTRIDVCDADDCKNMSIDGFDCILKSVSINENGKCENYIKKVKE